MFLVALTGNYGMGKSTVLSMFKDLGVATVDTDKLVESLFIEKKVLVKIKKLLGDRVFYKNGNLDKKKVAEIVFKDAFLRYSLEDILHRLKKNGVLKKDALLRLKAQLPIEDKMKKADFLIDNNSTLKETVAQVKKIYKKLMKDVDKSSTS